MYVIIGGDIILREENLAILLETIKPATPQWKAVGLALGFLDHELTIIERTPLLIPFLSSLNLRSLLLST